MPRCARVKTPDAMYHIMVRSISEVLLFKENEDKDVFLHFISIARKKHYFDIYSFCLMDNHAHFIIDPLGGNISKIMHLINTQYATYYNNKYDRIGPVFQGRFRSEIISSDRYLITASVYIHCNPQDLPSFKENIQLYQYSSLLDYIHNTDRFGILNTAFLTKLFGLSNKQNHLDYLELCKTSFSTNHIVRDKLEFIPEKYEYRSERRIILRVTTPKEVIDSVASYFNLSFNDIYAKRHRKYLEFRAICCYLMACFCNIPQKVIALILGNISQSSISKLITKGMDFIYSHDSLLNILII